MVGCTAEDLIKYVYDYGLNVAVSDENSSFKDRSKIYFHRKCSKSHTIIYPPLHHSIGGRWLAFTEKFFLYLKKKVFPETTE